MLVDVSVGGIVGITAQMYYWSAMISNVCHQCCQPSSVIVVGTHVDIVKKEYLAELEDKIKQLTHNIFKKHIFEKFISLNVIECHGDNHNKVGQRSPAISLTNHLMYAFLNDKVPSDKEVIALPYLMSLLEMEEPRVLPTETSEIIKLLTTLSEKGFIVFLVTDNDDSWIVLDQITLLEKVNGALFSPSHFKEHLPIASNTGIIPMSVLGSHLHVPSHNIEMIIQFLIKHQLCQRICLEGFNTNMAPQVPTSSDLLFFPPLISEERPHFGPNDITAPERCFGWLLHTDSIHQFFPNRFLHTLMLKLAHEICLRDENPNAIIQVNNRQCKVWRCGISWNSVKGVSTVIELMKESRLFLVMSFPAPKYCNELVPVLQTIKDTLCQFPPSIPATEYIVDPSKASTVFTQGCSVDTLTRVKLSYFQDALKDGDPTVVDNNNRVVHLNNWTSVEPCLSHLVSYAVNGKVFVICICRVSFV